MQSCVFAVDGSVIHNMVPKVLSRSSSQGHMKLECLFWLLILFWMRTTSLAFAVALCSSDKTEATFIHCLGL